MNTQEAMTRVLLCVALLSIHGAVSAQVDGDRIAALEAQVAMMQQQLADVKDELQEAREAASSETVQETAAPAQPAVDRWADSTSVTHLAGYASADFVSPEDGPSFFAANFNPMFHYLFSDMILWEAELEFEVEENGDTEIGLEYSTVDVFIGDSAVLVAGKFLSPVGFFRQNLHPSWINKLPTAPPGFGHDGAAPLAEVGLQLRGGVPFGNGGRFTYSGFIGNGPKIEAEDGEIHGVETEGFAGNDDDEFVYGGRLSFLPAPNFEVGLSGAFGDVTVVEDDGNPIAGDPKRDYTVFGVDANLAVGDLQFLGEYIKQEVGDAAASIAPEKAEWEVWYLQGTYRFPGNSWEGTVRYTDFTSPHEDDSQEQIAVGINYLLSPSAMIKLAYELNDGQPGEAADENRWLAQIAFGY